MVYSGRLMKVVVAVAAVGVSVGQGTVVSANHAWGYHWARTASPFSLIVVNSTTSAWDPFVVAAVADWSQSAVLDMVEDPQGATSDKVRRQCKAPVGQVRICNLAYGYNGWLGIAGISIDTSGHIVSGYTKLNDSYFATDYYNTDDWKQTVTCQELGHDIGLDHQDEDFDNTSLHSCMDYQDPPYAWANTHDFDELATIYAHLDSYNSYDDGTAGGGGGTCNAPSGKGCNQAGVGQNRPDDEWGVSLGRRGAHEKFIRIDADGSRHITFVTWAMGR
ncbi:MAG TPA: hypothetical protein VM818_17005 [Vicinamibacterales bacterium]|nr:hypothetical protein [Vicinamibacterales bacterium]